MSTPAWWLDGLTATLMREGVNKHRAKEIAIGYWEAYCEDDAKQGATEIDRLTADNAVLRSFAQEILAFDAGPLGRNIAVKHGLLVDTETSEGWAYVPSPLLTGEQT